VGDGHELVQRRPNHDGVEGEADIRDVEVGDLLLLESCQTDQVEGCPTIYWDVV
jgi:hypothetical protein